MHLSNDCVLLSFEKKTLVRILAYLEENIGTHGFAVRYDWFLIFTLTIPTVELNASANTPGSVTSYYITYCKTLKGKSLV